MEWQTNTRHLSAEDEDRRVLSVPEVVDAFERTAEGIRLRIHEMGFVRMATFYVWHDEQAGQLRRSTWSVAADELPFGGAYMPSDDLDAVVEGFLSDQERGVAAWSDLGEVRDQSEQSVPEPKGTPFPAMLVKARKRSALRS
ncbi:hypothetical protein [Streptomyces sp. NPDC057910]|uniref:hypothetical protein n=1 Tax=Streptomyces sp. NPDC057910 TaxID=3346278 RepID=UPI0036E92299